MNDAMLEKIIAEVMNSNKEEKKEPETAKAEQVIRACTITEFVGTAIGDTIGLVIANVDESLRDAMKMDKKFRSIGIVGGRTGAGPQIMAADESVKATNTEIVSIETCRDTKGGAGHGSLIIFGAEDVSDARRAVEVSLGELDRTFGDIYGNDAGHLEFQYTARASYACNKAFNAPIGKAFGLIVGAPAAIGVIISDTAVKAANVEVIGYASPQQGTCYTNEVISMITGDSGAVRQALKSAIKVGLPLLETLAGQPAPSATKPYI